MTHAPVLFVSHGSPMFAIEPGCIGAQLQALGRSLAPLLRAVLVVSPHWQSEGLRVSTTARPATLHDFGGFPAALYQRQYPVDGAPDCARATLAVLADAGFAAVADPQRGLDHGAWVPLLHLFPHAQLPVYQVSMPHDLDSAGAHRLGAALAPLRAQGVLLLGSGSLTHNLGEYRRPRSDAGYVDAFADWIHAAVLHDDRSALLDWEHRAPQARRAHPSIEHFLPLLLALGASASGEAVRWFDGGGVRDGILRMDACGWSLPDAGVVAGPSPC